MSGQVIQTSGQSAARRRHRRSKASFGTSKANMSEAEHMLDEIEHPAPRANMNSAFATIAAVVGAVGAIAAVLRPLLAPDGPRISAADLLIMFSAGVGAVVQLLLFLQSLKRTPQSLRAARYAKEMIADCQAQEDGGPADARTSGQRVATANTAPDEDAQSEEEATAEAEIAENVSEKMRQ